MIDCCLTPIDQSLAILWREVTFLCYGKVDSSFSKCCTRPVTLVGNTKQSVIEEERLTVLSGQQEHISLAIYDTNIL